MFDVTQSPLAASLTDVVPCPAGLVPVPGDCSAATRDVCCSQRRTLDRQNPTPSSTAGRVVVDRCKHGSRDQSHRLQRLVAVVAGGRQ